MVKVPRAFGRQYRRVPADVAVLEQRGLLDPLAR
jgi:hypothetical protein